MKYSNLIVSFMMAFLFMIGAASAGDEVAAPKVLNAEDAFDHMKDLNGTWKGEAVTVPVGEDKTSGVKSDTTVTYETIANDTSVVATYAEDTNTGSTGRSHRIG